MRQAGLVERWHVLCHMVDCAKAAGISLPKTIPEQIPQFGCLLLFL
jgi:hypothetical protein